jgi:3'(2'), 5'-bisphosphate nucleotidase
LRRRRCLIARHSDNAPVPPQELALTLSRIELMERVEAIALDAGRIVMEVYATDFGAHAKDDASPVTAADQRAEALIVAALQVLAPGIPIVAEEAVAAGHVPEIGERFWLVDALDGTKEFIKRNGEFTVNIALIDDAVPALGVVCAPALGEVFAGATGHGAYVRCGEERRSLACRAVPGDGHIVVSSASHGDPERLENFLAGRLVASHRFMGSSLKLCLLAAGEADLYPRFSRTMEWDIAAGHAVLAAAGGSVTDLAGAPLRYGKPGFENPPFVARGLCRP